MVGFRVGQNGEPTEMRLITLGTQAGPAIRGKETGIASAVVVGDSFYMVDFGLGCTRAAYQAGLRGRRFRAGFITHLHSDHIVELAGFLLWNWGQQVEGFVDPVQLFGPGADPEEPDRGSAAGTSNMVRHFLNAFSYDLRIRVDDESRPPLEDLISTQDITPTLQSYVERSPFAVFEDDRIRVTGILVDHPPVQPALAFRIESESGSVTFSGDTAESEALARLAQGTDILVHEAVNLDFYTTQDFNEAFFTHQQQSHTTPEGAGRIASAAGAHRLVLSHLAGAATADWWHDRAASTFGGAISVATSGQVFEIPQARSPGGAKAESVGNCAKATGFSSLR